MLGSDKLMVKFKFPLPSVTDGSLTEICGRDGSIPGWGVGGLGFWGLGFWGSGVWVAWRSLVS
ncbi:MAG TPA: hypothetical protein DCY88_03360 [Cyanobacteria bacterium UBA11372]|nr:hypothetical protein [Cyanobacteria bacterium UBA11372]